MKCYVPSVARLLDCWAVQSESAKENIIVDKPSITVLKGFLMVGISQRVHNKGESLFKEKKQ